jgi:hypothetical protein
MPTLASIEIDGRASLKPLNMGQSLKVIADAESAL